MSSKTIYPPIVDAYMPAFVGDNKPCQVFFSLSKFNSLADLGNNPSVHVSITKQNTGMNVVSLVDDTTTVSGERRFRSNGIIINAVIKRVEGESNLYYINIDGSELETGWQVGWIYKIQIRLSSVYYTDTSIRQADWLAQNANNFSEWSTICVVKATSDIDYEIPLLDIDTRVLKNEDDSELPEKQFSTLDIFGHFYRNDISESIYKYEFILYNSNNIIIEQSGDIYANQYQDSDSFRYTMRTELIDGETYYIAFKFETLNGYIGGFYNFNEEEEIDDRYGFICRLFQADIPPCYLISLENEPTDEDIFPKKGHKHYLEEGEISIDNDEDFMSIYEEEEEGRVGIKFYSTSHDLYSGNLCIRRADSRTNFKIWTDVYVYVAKQIDINTIPIFYDYTIESGVWYKYGVQTISVDGFRGELVVMGNPIIRNFNYSFLLGKNNQQLKLKFDNTMGSFKYQIYDSSIDPIGGTYPTITRNGNTYYRTFPINGLISFNMDDNKLFCDKKDIYNYADIVDLYNTYNKTNNISHYDYTYERDFRNKVLEFLQDGEIKLFKSPTEGNIIVRLTDVNCVPNQTLSRMVYNFSATAREMADNTIENYLKYGFYEVDPYATEGFSTYETRLGQISMDVPVGTNIFKEIYRKYDGQGQNVAGFTKKILNIHHIKITFDDKPFRVLNNAGEYVVGNNFMIGTQKITVYSPVRMYEFDERLTYYPSIDNLIILGDEQGLEQTVHVTIDFLYDFQMDKYIAKRIIERKSRRGIGQVFGTQKPGDSLYKNIYYKYYLELSYSFSRLSALSSIEIEANPGAAFLIRDNTDAQAETHIVGATGQLRLYEIQNIVSLVYLGMQNPSTGEIESKPTDVLMNYLYIITEGKYKQEE